MFCGRFYKISPKKGSFMNYVNSIFTKENGIRAAAIGGALVATALVAQAAGKVALYALPVVLQGGALYLAGKLAGLGADKVSDKLGLDGQARPILRIVSRGLGMSLASVALGGVPLSVFVASAVVIALEEHFIGPNWSEGFPRVCQTVSETLVEWKDWAVEGASGVFMASCSKQADEAIAHARQAMLSTWSSAHPTSASSSSSSSSSAAPQTYNRSHAQSFLNRVDPKGAGKAPDSLASDTLD